jgi:hypothetical protein
MAKGVAKFASAMFVGFVILAPVASNAQDSGDSPADKMAPPAAVEKSAPAEKTTAEECLTTPNGESPQGQQWRYRLERGTQRRCWYLRDRADRAAQPILTTVPAAAKPLARAADTPAPRPPALPPRAGNDARAELPFPRSRVDANPVTFPARPRPSPAMTIGADAGPGIADENLRRGPAMPRLSQPLDTFSASPPAADTTSALTNDAVTETNANFGMPAAPAVPVDTGVLPEVPPPPKTSLQKLLLVIFGALAFAGLTASLIHHLARVWRKRRVRQRRRMLWQSGKAAHGRPAPALQPASQPALQADRAAQRPARAEIQTPSEQAQGQIEELLGQMAERIKGQASVSLFAKSQVPAAARGQRPSARRDARASAVRP